MKAVTLCLILCTSLVYGQQVSDVSAKQFGNNIEIVYTVSGVDTNPYDVQVVYTADNKTFSKPMKHVYGDVGQSVSGNGSKKIIWDVLRETDSFDGNYAFKVILDTNKAATTGTEPEASTAMEEGKVGKFEAKIKDVSVNETNVVVKFSLVNNEDNENFKVHITKSKITGPDGKAYLAKSGRQGKKDQYGFMNVVLSKGAEVEVSLLFDYVPADIEYLKSLEIIRYIGLISSESIVFTNVDIPR